MSQDSMPTPRRRAPRLFTALAPFSAARLATLLAILSVLRSAGHAAADPAGFAFLEVPAGARASAMGGAFASLAEGAEAAHWNPGGLASLTRPELVASHSEFLEHLRHEHASFAIPAPGGAVAAAVRAAYSEAIPQTDALGNQIGSFGGHDLEFTLAYGGRPATGMGLGASVHLVRERIAEESTTTYSFGAGATWAPPGWPGVRFGMAVDQVGPAAHYYFDGIQGQAVPLPMAVQAGGSMTRALQGGLTLSGALEARVTRGRNAIGLVGVEIAHAMGAALRLGFRANDDTNRFSVGTGVGVQGLRLDYAFVPFLLDLGDTHRVSLGARF